MNSVYPDEIHFKKHIHKFITLKKTTLAKKLFIFRFSLVCNIRHTFHTAASLKLGYNISFSSVINVLSGCESIFLSDNFFRVWGALTLAVCDKPLFC